MKPKLKKTYGWAVINRFGGIMDISVDGHRSVGVMENWKEFWKDHSIVRIEIKQIKK